MARLRTFQAGRYVPSLAVRCLGLVYYSKPPSSHCIAPHCIGLHLTLPLLSPSKAFIAVLSSIIATLSIALLVAGGKCIISYIPRSSALIFIVAASAGDRYTYLRLLPLQTDPPSLAGNIRDLAPLLQIHCRSKLLDCHRALWIN